MTDYIELTGLRARGFHGVFADERRDGQPFIVDVRVGLDLARAASDDDLEQTVDYGALASRVVADVESTPVDLIETVAQRVCELVLADERVDEVTVTIHKPQAPITVGFDDVVVSLTRTRSRRPSRAVIALGSNLGDRSATLLAAASALAQHEQIQLLAISDLHDTVAVRVSGPDEGAPRFLNAVVLVETPLDPVRLLAVLHSIEAQFGRTREVRWGDRTLDLDLIDVDGIELDTPELQLPHPRAAERDFVLTPWLEVDPAAELVGHGPVRLLRDALESAAPATPPTPA